MELCLGLPESLRTTRVAGVMYTKALLRVAYKGALPAQPLRRVLQPPLNAVELVRYQRQRTSAGSWVEPLSPLVRLGVVDAGRGASLVGNAHEYLSGYRYVTAAGRLHQWLEHVAPAGLHA